MITPARLRDLALALPEAVQEERHGMDSYRVRGKIFATVPDRHHVRVMVDEAEIRAAVAEDLATFEAVRWGARLACVAVDLRRVPPDVLRQLLAEAWARKAPVSLVRSRDGRLPG
ncbi:MAG: MmcQ/YjbR family DNA-binding protein [Acidimicrobiales bacterium]